MPIFYASKVAKKSMRVYQTYINMMNEHVRRAHASGANPWEFTHVQNLNFGKGGVTGTLTRAHDTRSAAATGRRRRPSFGAHAWRRRTRISLRTSRSMMQASTRR